MTTEQCHHVVQLLVAGVVQCRLEELVSLGGVGSVVQQESTHIYTAAGGTVVEGGTTLGERGGGVGGRYWEGRRRRWGDWGRGW